MGEMITPKSQKLMAKDLLPVDMPLNIFPSEQYLVHYPFILSLAYGEVSLSVV